MKIPYYFIIILALALSCADHSSKNSGADSIPVIEPTQVEIIEKTLETRMSKDFLHGVWQNTNTKEVDFILHLNLVDELVLGEYCSKAKKIFLEDCAQEDGGEYCSVRGPYNNFNVEVGLESCLSAEISDAFIRRKGANIILILDRASGEYAKDHLVPDTMKLRKIANEPYF